MHVEQIWRHPVKSMIGAPVASAELDTAGIVGDRAWAVRDRAGGRIRGAKVFGDLMRLAARYPDGVDGPVEITLPGGATVSTGEHGADAAVSAAIGHAVTLEGPRPGSDGHGPRTRPHHDAFPLLIVSTSALRALQAALPGSVVDLRRFRPNLVVDTGGATGHPELAWVGRRLRVGDAAIDAARACPRCVMITRAIDDATPQDGSILRHVVQDLGHNVGVYATVTSGATIRVGDPVTVLDPPSPSPR